MEPTSGHGDRPRPKTLAQLDLFNAYARLGVSPLASTEEIRRVADQRRRELMRKRRTRSQQEFGAEEVEITELQEIENQIGSAKSRASYDRANPQNELLTIQPALSDRWLDPRHRASLITAWLVEELGHDVALPSPDSLALWAPNGIAPELLGFLQESFKGDRSAPKGAPDGPSNPENESFPGIAELDRARVPEPPNPEPSPKEDPTRV